MTTELTINDLLPLSDNASLTLKNGLNKFIQNFNMCTNGEYTIIPNQQYINTHSKLHFKHICGTIKTVSPSKFFMVSEKRVRTGCVNCETTVQVKDTFSIFNEVYTNSTEYTVIRPLVKTAKIRHNCGHVFTLTASEIERKTLCPNCNDTFGINIENKYGLYLIDTSKKSDVIHLYNFLLNFNNIASTEYTLLNNQEFKGAHAKLNVQHLSCGNIFEISPTNLLNLKRQEVKSHCKVCQIKKVAESQRYSILDFKKALTEKFNYVDEYEFLSEYVDTNTKLSIRHSICNSIIKLRPRELMMGHYCPKCTSVMRTSKGETEMKDFIKGLLPNVNFQENKRGLLDNPKLELDLYIPELKIAFEYNGDWWHREEVVKDRTHKKIIACANKDIRLITIMENEWRNKQEIVKDKLAYILKSERVFTKIYARKTIIKEVSPSEKNIFLDANHIQGKDKSYINLGLYSNNELVAIMTISKPRKALNSKDFELSRFATKIGTSVIGGFSKLLSKVATFFPPNTKLLTFASLAYSVGDVYELNGFTFSHISKPSYWYIRHTSSKLRKPLHRYNFNKKEIERQYKNGKLKFFDKTLTEKENMQRNGYYSYRDCGNLVYYYTLNKSI